MLMGRHDESRTLCASVLQTPIPRARNLCGFGALVAGDLGAAERLLDEDWREDPRARFGPFTFAASATHLAWIRDQAGRHEDALALLADSERTTRTLLDAGNEHWALAYNLAAIAVIRDDRDAALDWLDEAYVRGFRNYRLLELDPVLRSLAAEPRFDALARSMRRDFDALARELG